MNRRNVLIGLGGLVAGGGALLGTGAFTTVEAQRTVSVETAGDADAFLAFTPARDDEEFVTQTDGIIEINLDGTDAGADGINQNARSRFENLVNVQNNGTQNVDSLTFEINVEESTDDEGHENAFKIVSGETTIDADGETNLLDEADLTLESGHDVTFGVEIDLLIEGGIDEIEDDAEFTLTITAEAAE